MLQLCRSLQDCFVVTGVTAELVDPVELELVDSVEPELVDPVDTDLVDPVVADLVDPALVDPVLLAGVELTDAVVTVAVAAAFFAVATRVRAADATSAGSFPVTSWAKMTAQSARKAMTTSETTLSRIRRRRRLRARRRSRTSACTPGSRG
jgi:hypothetical protein